MKENRIIVNDFPAINSMKKALSCPFLAAGHGFVLKALLQEDLVVQDGTVIDKAGIIS